MDIRQKTVFVTGANRGIGAALVPAVLEAGAAKVYATTRQAGGLPAWSADARVQECILDVRDEVSVRAVAEAAPDVDLLVNNAGTLVSTDLLEASISDLETDFATNFYGLLHVARAFVPILRRRPRAAMVNVLTLVSVASMPAIGGYSASKAAAWSLTQALRAQLKVDDISVHGVYPGAVDTDMIRSFEMPKTSPEDVAAAIVRGVVEDREDIAPDPMAEQVWGLFLRDPKAVERQFAGL